MSNDFDGLLEGVGELIGALIDVATFNSMLPDAHTRYCKLVCELN